MPDIVTANDLETGAVVYLGTDGRWVDRLSEAQVAPDADSKLRLEQIAAQSAARQEVTAVYTMPVALEAGRPQPVSMRERIRAAGGPTV
jgi:sulfite reductase (NADPH) hemoprotein beta-component